MSVRSVTSAPASPDLRGGEKTRIGIAVGLGNLLEWFDFAIYGFFAVILGQLFFPSGDPVAGTLSSLSVFAAGFLARPLGGLIFGPLGDRYGRRASLVASVLLMGLATVAIGLLPPYAAIGVAAPILLVLLRLAQGVSAGGESGGAITYLVESAPAGRRGVFASILPGSAALGVALGSLVALFVQVGLPADQLLSWGWRLPFLIAAPLSLIGLYVRLKLSESPVFVELQRKREADVPMTKTRTSGRAIALAATLSGLTGLGSFFLATYLNTFLSTTAGWQPGQALLITLLGLASLVILCPFAGMLVDRWGRRRSMLIGVAGWVVFVIPSLLLMQTGMFVAAVAGFVLLSASQALIHVATFVLLAELFPAHTRTTAVSLTWNIAQAVIAGPGPLIAALLVVQFGFGIASAFYLIAIAVVTFVILAVYLPETKDVSLRE